MILYLYRAWWDLRSDCWTTSVLWSLFSVGCCAVTVVVVFKLPLSHSLTVVKWWRWYFRKPLWFQKSFFFCFFFYHLKAEADFFFCSPPVERRLHLHWLGDSDGDVISRLCLSPLLRSGVFQIMIIWAGEAKTYWKCQSCLSATHLIHTWSIFYLLLPIQESLPSCPQIFFKCSVLIVKRNHLQSRYWRLAQLKWKYLLFFFFLRKKVHTPLSLVIVKWLCKRLMAFIRNKISSGKVCGAVCLSCWHSILVWHDAR